MDEVGHRLPQRRAGYTQKGIVGGHKVYPAEVEDVILAQPNITDVVVSGEPHALLGAVVVARRLVDRLAAHPFLAAHQLDVKLTASVGVATPWACWRPPNSDSAATATSWARCSSGLYKRGSATQRRGGAVNFRS